jgi:hypothetical protein
VQPLRHRLGPLPDHGRSIVAEHISNQETASTEARSDTSAYLAG